MIKPKKIKFEAAAGFRENLDQPIPAKKLIPDWYKKMETYSFKKPTCLANGLVSAGGTIKACPPILDYLTSGYIITLPCDLLVTSEGGRQHFAWNVPYKLMECHNQNQIDGSPYEKSQPNKLNNPWAITTPKGYSCYFFKPEYCDTKGIECLPAIVDTDVFHEINFPFIYTGEDCEEIVIPKGTPIMQVFPFKRDNWEMSVEDICPQKKARLASIISSKFQGVYRDLFRVKKSYR